MNLEEKIFKAAFWFVCVCVILGLVAGCNPYEGLDSTPTLNAKPTATQALEYSIADTAPPPFGQSGIPHSTLSPAPPTCTVNASALYLRKGPGMSHAVTKILRGGDLLQVLKAGAWLKVETTQHLRGWVYSKYCTGD